MSKENSPLVSVIINCLNGLPYLSDAIACVQRQSYPNWEIILWDNASIQDIKSVADSFADSRIRYFRGERTVLLGEARNFAIAQAKGEFLAFLDSDDLWGSDKLLKQIPLFGDPEVALVYSDCESFNERGERKRYGLKRKFLKGSCFSQLFSDYHLVLSSVIIRAYTLKKYKIKFKINYTMIEEADVFLRLAYYKKVDHCPEVLASWRVHGKSLTWTKFHLLADETELMINDFCKMWPDIDLIYPSEFISRRIWVVRQRVIGLWIEGRGVMARACLVGSKERLPIRIWALYPITFLNASRWVPILYRFFGTVVSP